MTDAHCHVSAGNPSVREFLVGRDFFGVHPWEVSAEKELMLTTWLRGKLMEHPQAGVGEIGLDRLRAREISPLMRTTFESQLALALELGRPVVLHGAKCWGEVVKSVQQAIEQSSNRTIPTFLFHGFSRSDGLIPKIIALNGYISVGPTVLNDHAVNYRTLVKRIPADRLLLETDRDCSPEQVLNPQSGKPLEIYDVLTSVAEIRGISAKELERATDENATRFRENLI